MKRYLSHTAITSFVGDVLPLRLLGGEPFGTEEITWHLSGDCVHLKQFSPSTPRFNYHDDGAFTDGVLLTLLFPGSAKVICTFEGEEYICEITVREQVKASSEDDFDFFRGDLHDHTWNNHKRADFVARAPENYPSNYISQIRDEGRLDFAVVSDHGCLLDRKEFFRGFADGEDADLKDLVLFPGSEAEVTCLEKDRYGVVHKNSGEIVTFNANAWVSAPSWEHFFRRYGESPFAICTLAHPMIVGHSAAGVWNFNLRQNNTARFRSMIKLVEMGNGGDRQSNVINEYVYSDALDNGFRVCPTCSSDKHGPKWGFDMFPGKTIIMAKEKSREAFLDALMNQRVYASSSGNVKLRYWVNGKAAPAKLPIAGKYHFRVKISLFEEDPSAMPVKCQVISDGGIPVKVIEGEDLSDFEFDVESSTASWFFLRLVDAEGRRTWSYPVFTHREPYSDNTANLEPLSKSGMTAREEGTGEDLSVLISDDPYQCWISDAATASILLELEEETVVSGVGHYPRILIRKELADGTSYPATVSMFPSHYRISTSLDGENFTFSREGIFRVFGGEEVIRIPERKAKFVRLEILSTCGKNSELKEYADSPVALGEITLYRRTAKK